MRLSFIAAYLSQITLKKCERDLSITITVTDGLVDITAADEDAFNINDFYIMAIPFVAYDDAERKEKRVLGGKKNAATATATAP
eukprot:scaffold42165_cov155-Skeletonema_dohrnii-CCMP3373.AAC.5